MVCPYVRGTDEGTRWCTLNGDGTLEQWVLAEGEVTRLRELLRDFGRHAVGCSAAFDDPGMGKMYRCRCGWRDVAEAEGFTP